MLLMAYNDTRCVTNQKRHENGRLKSGCRKVKRLPEFLRASYNTVMSRTTPLDWSCVESQISFRSAYRCTAAVSVEDGFSSPIDVQRAPG